MSDRYRPLSFRRKLLIALLAVVTAVTAILVLLDPPGGVQRKRRNAAAEPPECSASQGSGCVGGKVDVIVPPRPSASGTWP